MCDAEPNPIDTEDSTDDDETAHGEDCYQSNSLPEGDFDTPKSWHGEEVDDEVKHEVAGTGGDQGRELGNTFAAGTEDVPVVADGAGRIVSMMVVPRGLLVLGPDVPALTDQNTHEDG